MGVKMDCRRTHIVEQREVREDAPGNFYLKQIRHFKNSVIG